MFLTLACRRAMPPDIAHSDLNASSRSIEELRLKRDFSAGERNSFLLRLKAGEALHLVIRQWGLRMALKILDGQGKLVEEMILRPRGESSVTFIALTTAAYYLIFTALDPANTEGSYQAILIDKHAATEEDETRIKAEHLFEEGERLKAEWNTAALRLATDKFAQAAKSWEGLNDWAQVVATWITLGDVYQLFSEYETALTYYQNALAVSSDNLLLAGLATCHNRISQICTLQGKVKEGLAYAQKALQQAGEIADLQVEADAYNNSGLAYYYQSQLKAALSDFTKARDLWQTLQDRSGQATALKNIGHVYFELGFWSRAVSYEEASLKLSRSLDDRYNEAKTLSVLGLFLSLMGERQHAKDYNYQALKFFERIGSLNDQAITLNSLGYLQLSLGEVSDSINTYQQTSKIYRKLGRPMAESLAFHYIGKGYEILGNYQQALLYYNRALKLQTEYPDARPAAYTWRSIGDVYRAWGRTRKALVYYRQAARTSRRLGDRQNWADSVNGIGLIYLKAGALSKARAAFAQALALNRHIKDRIGQISTLYNIALAAYNERNLKAALIANQAALAIIEDLRTKVINQKLRASYFATVQQHYQLNIDILMRLHRVYPGAGYDRQAFEVSERSRARSLLEMLAESHVDITVGADKELLEEDKQLHERYAHNVELRTSLLNKANAPSLLSKEDKERLNTLEREIQDLIEQQDRISDQLKKQNAHYLNLTQVQPLTIKQIQQQVLDKDTLLLEYAMGERRSFLWLVSANSFAAYELPSRATLEGLVNQTYALLANPKDYYRDGPTKWSRLMKALGQALLKPAYPQLGNKRLLVVADGSLHKLPFSILPASPSRPVASNLSGVEPPLIVTHEIVYLPSASTLGMQRRILSGRPPAPHLAAVFAEAVYSLTDHHFTDPTALWSLPPKAQRLQLTLSSGGQDGERGAAQVDLSPLPFSKDEAAIISDLVPATEIWPVLGFAATRENALSQRLRLYRMIHFAVHGQLDSQQPDLSGLWFSMFNKAGERQNGFFGLEDVYNLELAADLVVLSACETGLGRDVKGEGVIGLPRGFMYAGAKRVIATLWKVEDYHTAELLKLFYVNLLSKNVSAAAALRTAQIEMWKRERPTAPYYWAGFVLQGEYQ